MDSSSENRFAASPLSDPPATEGFDWVLHSPIALPPVGQWRYATLDAMLETADPEQDCRPLLVGADRSGELELSLADLRRVRARARLWCRQHDISPGDSLLLVRLPYSSEVPLAAAVLALMTLGMRVVLPMSFDRDTLSDIARLTNCRAILWCASEAAKTSHAQVRQADAMYRDVAAQLGMVSFSLDGTKGWHIPADAGEAEPAGDNKSSSQEEREVLVLSTSGSTGRPKLVRYTNLALLRVAEAWNAAGLMSEELTGGSSICPALSHSMGLRNVLHAIWNRQPTLLVQTEWLEEQPKEFVKLLERCPPQHITCGPALLSDLGLMSANLERVREALASLRCVVSSGAVEAAKKHLLSEGVRTANAFGMTEMQQVLNTLVGPASNVRGALGRPLPGVSVAIRYEDATQKLGRLFVAAPFAARGYVNSPDFGRWFDTGDLVRLEGNDLVWIGRSDEDFLSTGQGVKVSLAELRDNYEQLQQEVEAVLYVDIPPLGGLAAIVYVGQRDPTSADVHRQLLQATETDHRRMESKQRDFALHYMAISRIGCVAGQPPKQGPGKMDRKRALTQQADLLTAMNDPTSDHPQVIVVPQLRSDRPDWRRFVSESS